MTTPSSTTGQIADQQAQPASSTAVAPRVPATAVGLAPDVDALWRQCVALSKADILPEGILGSPGNIFAVAILGQQFGMPVMNACLAIHVIPSKGGTRHSFALAANLWVALARRAGHKVKKGEHTAERCTMYLWRRGEFDDDPHEATYTIEDAKTAGLLGNDNYRKNPKAMLYARAASTVVREAAGEVAMGFIDPYEAWAMQHGDAPAPESAATGLADAVAQRTAAADPDAHNPAHPGTVADDGVVDAEVVPEPPSATDVADLVASAQTAPEGAVEDTPDAETPKEAGEDPADAVEVSTYADPVLDEAGDLDESLSPEDPCPGCGSAGPRHLADCPAMAEVGGQVAHGGDDEAGDGTLPLDTPPTEGPKRRGKR